jgi:glycosidase
MQALINIGVSMSQVKKPLNQLVLSLALVFSAVHCRYVEADTVPLVSEIEPSQKASQLAPYQQRSFQDEVFYFVLPDRFYNADPNNDSGAKANDTKRALSRGGLDVTHKGMYHGGDLAGLTEKLPYLDQMGITAIWLTPILRNRAMQAGTSGYHGYWILDFTEIDPHLGSNAELKHFIDQAHQRNIKVYFDIITNHTADVIKYEECHGKEGLSWIVAGDSCPFKATDTLTTDKYTPLIPKGDEAIKIPAWLNDMELYHNQGDSHWSGESALKGDFAGLDDLKTTEQKVVDGMIDIYKDLISEFKPDGFRIDTVKHVNMEFWQDFSPALMNHAKSLGINNFMMFGEAYSFEAELLSKFMTVGKIPSVLDFALQGAIEAVLVNQQGPSKLADLFAQDYLYQTQQDFNANHLVNFTGNHDMGRLAGKFYSSDHNYSEDDIIKRTLLAHALIFFSRGVPVVYYGDEQGFTGDGGDQDARQNMMPSLVKSYNDDNLLATDKTAADQNFDQNHPFYQRFARYAELYQQYPALRKGQQTTLLAEAKPGIFAIKRSLVQTSGKTQSVVAVFNTSVLPKNVKQLKQLRQLKLTESATLIYSENAGNQGRVDGLSVNLYLL